MPYSYAVYTGNGTNDQFTVSFPYIRKEHVVASVNYVSATFTWVNDSVIQLDSVPANAARVEVRRVTPVTAPLVDFADGSTLVAADLDTVALQQTYINQEQDDQIQDGVFINAQGLLDAGGQRITNVGNPTGAQDAATKAYVDTTTVASAGDTMTGPLAMGTNKITGLGDPTNAQDAATKSWVETATTSPLQQFRSIFYGAYATDPAVDPYGAARTEGDLYFNTTLDQMRVFNGTSWQEASADATITRFKFTAAGGETSLSGNDDNAQSLTYNVGLEMVYLNGALLTRGVDYTATNGTSITGLVALAAADLVEVVAFSQINALNSIPGANIADGTVTSAKITDGTIVNADVNASAGIVASKLSFTQAGAGAVARTVDNKLKDVVSVKDFGAVGDGVADDTAAIQAAVTASSEVVFPAGTYRVGSNVTIAASKRLVLAAGAVFSVNTGITLTIYATVNANPNSFIFQGLGTVVGLGDVYPEWWGAAGDGVTNDQPAFQKAVTCLQSHFQSSGSGTVHLQSKAYLLGSTWTIYQHSNAPINVIGTGTLIGQTRLLSSASHTGTLIAVDGTAGGGSEIVDFTLKGFAIISQNLGVGAGLVFNNDTSSKISGLQESLVENVHITDFKFGMIVRRTRLVHFHRLSIWQSNINGSLFANANQCLTVENTGSAGGTFTGDMTFSCCQFVNSKQLYSNTITLSSSNASGPSNMGGIRFDQCIIYRGGDKSLKMITNNNCDMGDIWISKCQFDDTTGIFMKTNSANDVITDVHINNCYFTSSTSNAIGIDAAASPGRINCIGIDHCSSAGSGITIEASNATNLVVTNNRLSGCTAPTGAPLVFFNCNEVNVIGNSAGRFGPLPTPGGFQNLVYFLGTGNRYVAIGNNSAGLATGALINDTTGAANTAYANNI